MALYDLCLISEGNDGKRFGQNLPKTLVSEAILIVFGLSLIGSSLTLSFSKTSFPL
jgi:hypothetical protein